MLTFAERREAFDEVGNDLRTKAVKFAKLRLRDLVGCGLEADDLAQEALARLWLVAERISVRSRIDDKARYLALLSRLRLRYSRRLLAYVPAEPVALYVPAELRKSLPMTLRVLLSLYAGGVPRLSREAALLICGSDNGSAYERLSEIDSQLWHILALECALLRAVRRNEVSA